MVVEFAFSKIVTIFVIKVDKSRWFSPNYTSSLINKTNKYKSNVL